MVNWDQYFMGMARFVSIKSKDINTKVGCVIVGSDNEVRSTGYNSFPRGINDNVSERQERPEKYFWFAHAERNAIYNAARVGIPLKGSTIYCQNYPCTDCTIAIIQSGITKIVVPIEGKLPNFEEKYIRSEQMLKEAGVEVKWLA